MMSPEEALREFHASMGDDVDAQPAIRNPELRLKLMYEELEELRDAVEAYDLNNTAKELADLIYVVYGTAVTFGLKMDPIFEAVHRSNMSKFDGAQFRADGKLLKGPNYQPADAEVVAIVEKQRTERN